LLGLTVRQLQSHVQKQHACLLCAGLSEGGMQQAWAQTAQEDVENSQYPRSDSNRHWGPF
jgi:hypothetical protein